MKGGIWKRNISIKMMKIRNKKIAPTDKGGAQTAAGHGIQLLKSNDTPGIY